MKSSLTIQERKMLEQLSSLAGGVNHLGQLKVLNAQQSDALCILERKGYVLTTVGSYMVIEKLGPID